MDTSKLKIAAVVVTYKNLELLKKCIDGIKTQSRKLDQIIVVSNGSEDDSAEWLRNQDDIISVIQQNVGGAGGFKTGIKKAFDQGFDWIWCLDQDIIPDSQALSNITLSNAIESDNTGFITSVILTMNNQLVYINVPQIDSCYNVVDKLRLYNELPIISSSFSSVLINSKAIEKVGLPYKDFFIWGDDAEYTMRIIQGGFSGFLVPGSRVKHHIDNNIVDPFSELDINSLKLRYGLRNFIFVNMLRNRIVFKSTIRGLISSTSIFLRIAKKRYFRNKLKFFTELPILIIVFLRGLLFKPKE